MLKRTPIKIKNCKCSVYCKKYPTMGYAGYFSLHAPEEIKERIGTKRQVQVRNRNKRIALSAKLHKAQKELNGGSELDLWYLARKFEMTGRCSEEGCTKPTNKFSDKYYRWSVCHIVPKSLVPSVATNFLNWIELCQDHHNEFDSTFEAASKIKIFPEVKRMFGLFKHLIPTDELRKVNPHLL